MLVKFLKNNKIKDIKKYTLTNKFSGFNSFEFEYCNDLDFIKCEDIILINNIKYIIKEVAEQIYAEIYLKDFNKVIKKEYTNKNINYILSDILPGYNIQGNNIPLYGDFNFDNVEIKSAISELIRYFNIPLIFLNDKIKIVDKANFKENIFLSDYFGIKNITKSINTIDIINKVTGYGKDGLVYSKEDTTYTNDIYEYVFEDDRIEKIQTLKNKVENILKEKSKPQIILEIEPVEDLKLDIHDEINIVLKDFKKIKHRVIEKIETEEKTTIKLSNKIKDVANIINDIKNTNTQINQHFYNFKNKIDENLENINNEFENHLKNGYVYKTPNAIYILDNEDKNKAKKVIKMGIGGILGTDNGYNGTYNIAITPDGKLNGREIISGSITSDKLVANILQSSNYDDNNGTFFDLVSGELTTNQLKAKKGKIGGFIIENEKIKNKNGSFILDPTGSNVINSNNFNVSSNGVITCQNINITGGSFKRGEFSHASAYSMDFHSGTIGSDVTIGNNVILSGTGLNVHHNSYNVTAYLEGKGQVVIGVHNGSNVDSASGFLGGILTNGKYSNPSDQRLKKEIYKLDESEGLKFIDDIDIYSFKLKNGDNKNQIGIIAQEVLKNTNDNLKNIIIDEVNGYYSADYIALSTINILAVKKLIKENEKLKNEIEQIKKEIIKNGL